MSEVYVNEPATAGRVVLQTNRGELVIDLWSREAPGACRQFLQLCLDRYYDGTTFHRIIPGFLVQAGDSESPAKPDTVPLEIHQRLKFRYRGMVGLAEQGQFFITLSKQDMLNGKHTLFGKLVGDSIFNLDRIAAVDVDSKDRPTGADGAVPCVVGCKVMDNPFKDIVSRLVIQERVKTAIPAVLNRSLLSFDPEDDDFDRTVSAYDILPHLKSKTTAQFPPESVPAPVPSTVPVPVPVPEPASPVREAINIPEPNPAPKQKRIEPKPAKKVKRSDDEILAELKGFSKKIKSGPSEWFTGKVHFPVDSLNAFNADSSKK